MKKKKLNSLATQNILNENEKLLTLSGTGLPYDLILKKIEFSSRNMFLASKRKSNHSSSVYVDDPEYGQVGKTTNATVQWINWLSQTIKAGTNVSVSVLAKASAPTLLSQYFNAKESYLPMGNITTEWKKYFLVRKIGSDLTPSNTIFHFSLEAALDLYIAWICVTVGNVPLFDWSPAWEDLQFK